MNLYRLLREREHDPVQVGIIGVGKFATMFLAQARRTPGLRIAAICDLDAERARAALRRTGWSADEIATGSLAQARAKGAIWVTSSGFDLIAVEGLEVVVEATGDPAAGVCHALACCDAGRHVVMVNVEGDALAGPLLAQRAADAGIVYSLAYGDQPALIAELVDGVRASGFDVVCAGKGTKYLPEYHASTPDTIWDYYGLTPEQAERAGMNPKMFNSFLDGTKSAVEMAAVANTAGLLPAPGGLGFPPCDRDSLAEQLKPKSAGGLLSHKGTVEVVSCLRRDGSEVDGGIRWAVYVTFEAGSDYVADCFAEYGLQTDSTGGYSALYRPYHLVGLELGVSVASVSLRREPTGAPRGFYGDVIATAKRDLGAGETLDGEGGYTVWGRLVPAKDSLAMGGLPIGLAQGVRLERAVEIGAPLRWSDVQLDEGLEAVRVRREMEDAFHAAKE